MLHLTSQIIAFECGELDNDETIELFQSLVDTGLAWQLQGSYGRAARDLIDAGLVRVGPTKEQAIAKLPARVTVRISEDACGFVTLTPVKRQERELLDAIAGEDAEAFVQAESEIAALIECYPATRYLVRKESGGYRVGKRWYQINDGATFEIPTDEFLARAGVNVE